MSFRILAYDRRILLYLAQLPPDYLLPSHINLSQMYHPAIANHHHSWYNDQYQLLHFWHLAASEMHKESDLFPKMQRRTLRYVRKWHLQYRIQDTKENTKCGYHEILLYCTSMLECNQEPMQSYPDQMHSASSTAKTVQR